MSRLNIVAMEDYLVTKLEAHSYLGDSANVTTIEARRDWSFPDERYKAMGFANAELPGVIVQNRSLYGARIAPKPIAKDCWNHIVPMVFSGIVHTSAIETALSGAIVLMQEIIDALEKISEIKGQWGVNGTIDGGSIEGLHFHVPEAEHSSYGICSVFCNMEIAIST